MKYRIVNKRRFIAALLLFAVFVASIIGIAHEKFRPTRWPVNIVRYGSTVVGDTYIENSSDQLIA